MSETFTTAAHIKKVETTADRGVKLTIYTQEIDAEAAASLFSLKDKYGYFVFKETEITDEDVSGLPDFKPEFKSQKTPSERLRGVLYRLWEAKGKPGAFDPWYAARMEDLIDHYKKQLPEL